MTETRVAGNKQPRPVLAFEPGPAIEPADVLRLWLETHPDATVRMPVTVEFTVLGVSGGRVGELALSLDDTAMGISLHDRMRQHCGVSEGSCAVWLEGTPGALVGPSPALDDTVVFAVRAVVDLIDPTSDDVTRIQVATSTGE